MDKDGPGQGQSVELIDHADTPGDEGQQGDGEDAFTYLRRGKGPDDPGPPQGKVDYGQDHRPAAGGRQPPSAKCKRLLFHVENLLLIWAKQRRDTYSR